MDKEYKHYPKIDSLTLKNIPLQYNRMKQDSNFTNKNWTRITDQNADSVFNLSYELMLAILNGSKECIPLFENLRKDFNIIRSGSASEENMGCENVLEVYGYIKEKNQDYLFYR